MLSRYPAMMLVTHLVTSPLAAGTPADPDLNPRGRAILAWFQQLSASPELRLVSGQFLGWSGSGSLEEVEKIHRASGQRPAMIGLDYCAWLPGNRPDMAGIDTRTPNEFAKNYWRDGGLVDISWHATNPSGGSLKTRDLKLADLLVPGPLHDRWLESLDRIAAGLQELQEAGVVVLWRPFHEMNGGWFWWGAQEPADFIAAWRQMFDYFTREKKLHNLIWIFSPNHGQRNAPDYYPGDTAVDLAGFDAYTDNIDPQHIKGYPGLVRLNKPFGFTEYGPHASSNPPGDFDYRRLLDDIGENFPLARHFLCWNQKWNPAENRFAREFYNDPRVITRDQIPAGLTGK